jgi:hypothetical protein
MLYNELFGSFEKVRWDMGRDIPWASFDAAQLTEEQARTIKMNAITEWSALPATEMFLRDNQDDSDFSAFMSIWFYEEQKHALVLMEYLRRFRPELVPTEDELHAVRFPFDPAPAMETLMLHFCGEIRLTRATPARTSSTCAARSRNSATRPSSRSRRSASSWRAPRVPASRCIPRTCT